MPPYVYLVMAIHNAEKYLPDFLDSLRKQTYRNFGLVVLDDGSTDRSREIIRSIFAEAVVLTGDGSYWWTRSINECLRNVLDKEFKYVFAMNVDLVMKEDFIEKMVESAANRDDVILGSAIYDIDTMNLHSVGYKWNWWTAKLVHNQLQEGQGLLKVTHLGGRGLLIPKRVLLKMGLFDERTFPQYFADGVFTAMAGRKGYSLYCNSNAILFTHVNETGSYRFLTSNNLCQALRYFLDTGSPGRLVTRWRAGLRMAPRWYAIPFIIIDTFRVLVSFARSRISLHSQLVKSRHASSEKDFSNRAGR